jgi:hypothetical protein
MTVRTMTAADLDWAVSAHGRRREALVPHAPVYWRPAAGASGPPSIHRLHTGLTLAFGDRARSDSLLWTCRVRGERQARCRSQRDELNARVECE